MENIHLLNIGYPKCSTTWMYNKLKQQEWFSSPREKENKSLVQGIQILDYCQPYLPYKITGNFFPVNFILDRYQIKLLSQIPSVSPTIILRNPFEIYFSLYNFLHVYRNFNYSDFVRNLVNQGWFNDSGKIIYRWQQYFDQDRFFVFFYDDLKENPILFFKNYCKKLSLPEPKTDDSYAIKNNSTKYKENLVNNLDQDLIDIINNNIDQLQLIITCDLNHWKK